MSLFAAVLVVFAAQGPTLVPPEQATAKNASPPVVPSRSYRTPKLRKASFEEAAAFLSEGFEGFDKDGSGFLDAIEASVLEPRDPAFRDRTLPTPPPAGERDPAAEAKWLAKLDRDRDDLVSRHEYVEYMIPWLLYQGIREDWRPADPSTG